MTLQQAKQRFGIVGNSDKLNYAIELALRVAPTEVSVLIVGESGVGKERMPQIIHQNSSRKHEKYIAVNCGAIPEGTIDSELFGHEKGAFTGASESRKGYFEEANGGTIFLDEVGELPLTTQVRLLRVLETGEFIKVGSSKVQKTDVRIVAATNVNMKDAVVKGKFREDLFYRLSSVPIDMPPLRQRGDDIHLLFRKFSADFSEKYRVPPIKLDEEAVEILQRYSWPGNVRQLKNVTEQIAIVEKDRLIDRPTLLSYLPQDAASQVPALYTGEQNTGESYSDRELLYKVLFDLKKDVNDLKQMVLHLAQEGNVNVANATDHSINQIENRLLTAGNDHHLTSIPNISNHPSDFDHQLEIEESYSLADSEKELIIKALKKHNNKRKSAAKELGISERTLYRKIKEYNI